MDDDQVDVLRWECRYSMLHGRTKALTLETTTFPQEKFLSEVVGWLNAGVPLQIKVCAQTDEGIKVIGMGDPSVVWPDGES